MTLQYPDIQPTPAAQMKKAHNEAHKDTVSPLPWEACGNVVRDAEGIEVCTAALWRDHTATVNANLIAAAPDLLAALEALVDAPFLSGHDVYVREVQAAEAAISKARGGRA